MPGSEVAGHEAGVDVRPVCLAVKGKGQLSNGLAWRGGRRSCSPKGGDTEDDGARGPGCRPPPCLALGRPE